MGITAVERATPVMVLAELSACDRAEKAAAARRLELAVVWAGLHPGIAAQPYDKVVDSLIDETTGATVEAIAEFAAVHGVSTSAGRQLIGDAVTMHDRLPRCWQQMTLLRLPAWKARILAQHASRLGDQAVGWLDTHAAQLGDKLGVRTIKRLALIAIARFEPENLTDPAQHRWVRIRPDGDHPDGGSWMDGRLDTPDALDLEAALRLIAADLAGDGVDADLDARRAQAVGVMARRALGQLALPATAESGAAGQGATEPGAGARADREDVGGLDVDPAGTDRDASGGSDPEGDPERGPEQDAHASDDAPALHTDHDRHHLATAREAGHTSGGMTIEPAVTASTAGLGRGLGRPVSIYLHVDATQLATCTGLGELGSTGQLVTIDQIRAWCGAAGSITIRPVIDLNDNRTTRSYQPTDAMREHLALRDQTCVFPYCTRTAHPVRRRSTGAFGHDADHITPFEAGGKTSTDNLACLCRPHHLLKTHTRWRYRAIGPGEYLWTSPTGRQLLRTAQGTTLLTAPGLVRDPGPPDAGRG